MTLLNHWPLHGGAKFQWGRRDLATDWVASLTPPASPRWPRSHAIHSNSHRVF